MTFRDNYAAFESDRGAAQAACFAAGDTCGAAESAAYFWKVNGCNSLAESGDVGVVRRQVNGGDNGRQDVRGYYARLRLLISPGS